MNELFVKIRFVLPSLPRAEKSIAEALLENPQAISNRTLAELSMDSSVSEASIVRFCKRLGFSGFTEMKAAFIKAIDEGSGEPLEEKIEKMEDMKAIIRKVYESNVQTLSNTMVLAGKEYDEALKMIIQARSVCFFGTGDAYAVCQLANMKFKRLGLNCFAESDVMLMLTAANNMTKDDVAIAISYEGRSKNVVSAMKIAKQRNAKTISITNRNKSPLLKYTDVPLFTAVTDLSVGRDKVTRRISDQFVIDVLYIGYLSNSGRDCKRLLKQSQMSIDLNKI